MRLLNCNALPAFEQDYCQPIVAVLGASAVLSVTATSFLFFLRVRAVYLASLPITIFFGMLWIAIVTLVILTNAYLRTGQ